VFRIHFGDKRYEQGRQFYRLFSPYVHVQEPDLMIHPDFCKVRFAEVKRMDTNDRLNEAQLRGMALLKLLYGCEVDIFYVVEEGRCTGTFSYLGVLKLDERVQNVYA